MQSSGKRALEEQEKRGMEEKKNTQDTRGSKIRHSQPKREWWYVQAPSPVEEVVEVKHLPLHFVHGGLCQVDHHRATLHRSLPRHGLLREGKEVDHILRPTRRSGSV